MRSTVDGKDDADYTFPASFVLKAGSKMKVMNLCRTM